MRRIYIGTAGWGIPRSCTSLVAASGTALEKYAGILPSVEINTTFYRRHQVSTFERWSRSVPADFRFAVKLPRQITHEAVLTAPRRALEGFFEDVGALGSRLGPILVQLPASLDFERRRAIAFFRTVRRLHPGAVVLEPRHPGWYAPQVEALLREHDVARVAADPPRPPAARTPGGSPSVVYYRLHGSPRTYWSAYEDDSLRALAGAVRAAGDDTDVWCIFDNTASGAALADATRFQRLLLEP